jgi:hypothetical protein
MIALGLMAGLLSATVAHAQAPAQQAPAQPPTAAVPNDGGMVLIFIKPDKTADFEMVMGKLKEARRERKLGAQTAGGRLEGSSSRPIPPVPTRCMSSDRPGVEGADYRVSNIIAERSRRPRRTTS